MSVGQSDDLEDLVRRHFPLVKVIAKRAQVSCHLPEQNVDINDLISAGGMALWAAAKEYDPKKGQFWNWAYHKIWWAVLDELRNKCPVSRYHYDKLKSLRRMEYELACRLGRLPEEEEIAEALRISSEELIALRQMEVGVTTLSLEAVTEGGSERSRIVAQEACTDPSPFEELSKKEKVGTLVEGLAKLDEKQRKIITLKIYEERTFEEIAEMLQENMSNVQTLYYRALKELKKHVR